MVSHETSVREQLRRYLTKNVLCAGCLQVPKRSMVYSSGQEDRRIYVLEQGWVKTVTISSRGKECLLGLYGPGDVFGELGFVQDRRLDSAIALTQCTVRPVNRRTKSVSSLPSELVSSLLELCLQRASEQQCVITDLVTSQSEARLAAALLRLARKFGTREGSTLYLDASLVTQQELSEMVGTTRSRIGYFLRGFAECEMIHRVGGSLVLHEQRIDAYLMSEV